MSLIKTEVRPSRNEGFTERINNEICRLAASKITDEMVIAIDPGDISEEIRKEDGIFGKNI